MPGLFARAFGGRKRRIKEGMRDDKTFRLHRAACLLLAERDYEQIPVAHFAQQADISVGSLYKRFADKDAFLSSVVAIRCSDIRHRMEDKLDLRQWQHQPAAVVTRAIVDEMIRNLHGYGAGVVRAALKRGHCDRTELEPLQRYRTALADRAVALLAERVDLKKPERAVRAAMQMAEATALDALLHERGPLRPGSWRMAATLSAMMLGMLALTNEADDNDTSELVDDDDAERMLDMPIEEVVALPIPESSPARKSSRPKQEAHTEPAGKIPMVKPLSVQPPQQDEKPELPKKGRHRPQF